eukprot:2777541-Amphidinium_carterae.1
MDLWGKNRNGSKHDACAKFAATLSSFNPQNAKKLDIKRKVGNAYKKNRKQTPDPSNAKRH